MRWVGRVADPRDDLEAKNEGVQEIAPAHSVDARISEERRGYRRGGVDVVFGQRVVIVVDVRRQAVEQRCEERIKSLRPANHGRCRQARVGTERRDRNLNSFMVCAPQRTPHDVDERALALVPNLRGDRLQPAAQYVIHESGCVSHPTAFRTANPVSARRKERRAHPSRKERPKRSGTALAAGRDARGAPPPTPARPVPRRRPPTPDWLPGTINPWRLTHSKSGMPSLPA